MLRGLEPNRIGSCFAVALVDTSAHRQGCKDSSRFGIELAGARTGILNEEWSYSQIPTERDPVILYGAGL